MFHLSPVRMIVLGFLLSVAGVVLPFLMVIHMLQSTFFLDFLSYIMMVGGLIFGIAGASQYVRLNRKDE